MEKFKYNCIKKLIINKKIKNDIHTKNYIVVQKK